LKDSVGDKHAKSSDLEIKGGQIKDSLQRGKAGTEKKFATKGWTRQSMFLFRLYVENENWC